MSREGDSDPARTLAARYCLDLQETEQETLDRFVGLLRHWGKRINLAGPSLLADPYPHLLEAFWACRQGFVRGRRLVDIGSGCGIPGLVLASANQELEVLLVERNQKKAVFLREAARQLGLAVCVFDRRFQELEGWEGFDLATLRALKPAPELLNRLLQAKLSLLWFRGGFGAPHLPGFELQREERVPASMRRWVSFYSVR